ncbi:MAG: pyridoxamine 5'-phosphate oxidase [Aureliella sp.]
MGIEDLRRNYQDGDLRLSDFASCPIEQFNKWMEIAADAESPDWLEINAATLATASADGSVSARIVLLKKVIDEGFVIFTNYLSTKGKQLAENPRASLVLYWPHVEKQVRIEGSVAKSSPELSDEYFHARPRGSQIGAVVSPQSDEIGDRTELEQAAASLEQELAGAQVPRPDHWGGYVISPSVVEFWQGRPSRLHDRFVYTNDAGKWTIKQLAP